MKLARYPFSNTLTHCPQVILVICALLTLLATSSSRAMEHSPPSSTASEALLRSGALMFPGIGKQQQPGILLSSEASIEVSAMVARVTLKQRFRNPSNQWSEAIYQFPLPSQSAVDQLRIQIGERLIIGEIQEKQQARATYAKARAAGKATGLVEQQRANLFTSKMANIPPGETLSIEISYLQQVSYQQGSYSLSFPMTLTPRYIPGTASSILAPKDSQPGWANNTDQVPDASEITPPQTANSGFNNRIKLRLSIDAGVPLANLHSSSHPLQVHRQQLQYQVQPAAGMVAMDRDFHLSWTPGSGNAPAATLLIEKNDQEMATDKDASTERPDPGYYSMLTLLPPEPDQQLKTLSREQIYIIDTSGSMSGDSIKQAKAALKQAIRQLGPDDSFNIIEFNSHTQALYSQPNRASMFTISEALQFIGQLRANGGTEIAPALEAAFSQPRSSADTSQIIFITDGSIGNEAQLLQQIEQQRGERRLFTIAIGSAPNRFFMRKAAQFGQGSFTQINSPAMVKEQISQLFSKLNSPLMSNININWPAGAEHCPNRAADLFASEPLVVYCRLDHIQGKVTVSGQQGSRQWLQQIPLKDLHRNATGVTKLWARHQIERLEDEQIGLQRSETLKSQILAVALQHQLVSRYTSLVAVEHSPIRPPIEALRAERVANLLPAGSRMSAFPTTATASPLLLASGFLLLLLGLGACWTMRRKEFSCAA